MDRGEYVGLCLELLRHCYLYYECDAPIIEDHVYDRKYAALFAYEAHNPDHILTYSPTQFVGFNHCLLQYNEVP